MACTCTKIKNKQPSSGPVPKSPVIDSVVEARSINLAQCYECAKKHLSRAKEEFKEYHTGYPTHIKNLMQSIRVTEAEVRRAFLKWEEIQGQLDMSAGELLGREVNELDLKDAHIQLANKIRIERLKFNENPMYIPDFDQLLVDIHYLEYATIG